MPFINDCTAFRSREDMAQWKEKQLQVSKEEARVKASMEKLRKSAARRKVMTPRDRELQAKVGFQLNE